jgi:hypothetical protein
VAKFEDEVFIWGYPPKSNKNFAFDMFMGSEVQSFGQNITSDRSFVGPRTKFWPKLRLQTKNFRPGISFFYRCSGTTSHTLSLVPLFIVEHLEYAQRSTPAQPIQHCSTHLGTTENVACDHAKEHTAAVVLHNGSWLDLIKMYYFRL